MYDDELMTHVNGTVQQEITNPERKEGKKRVLITAKGKGEGKGKGMGKVRQSSWMRHGMVTTIPSLLCGYKYRTLQILQYRTVQYIVVSIRNSNR